MFQVLLCKLSKVCEVILFLTKNIILNGGTKSLISAVVLDLAGIEFIFFLVDDIGL